MALETYGYGRDRPSLNKLWSARTPSQYVKPGNVVFSASCVPNNSLKRWSLTRGWRRRARAA